MIIKEGLEVGGGFETIPLGSNNLGEFSGCLAGLQQVIGFRQHVEMVGDCKILTEAAPKTKLIDNFELNEILSEIRNIAESKFAFFFLRFRHQVPFIRVKKPSLGWKRGGKKGRG